MIVAIVLVLSIIAGALAFLYTQKKGPFAPKSEASMYAEAPEVTN
eukprot:COSAG01_NODE_3703_length_5778_cov_4.653812_2_plen_45_part_00